MSAPLLSLLLGACLTAQAPEPSAPAEASEPATTESTASGDPAAAQASEPPSPTTALVPAVIGEPLRGFRFKLGGMDEAERGQLEGYLSDLVGAPLTFQLLVRADERLAALRRYERARCQPQDDAFALCDIWRARVLREVRVEGLPTAILESDLRKRVFLRPGEPIDEEAQSYGSGKSRLVRQRNRIEDFLEREGFHGAEVRLLVKKVAADHGERDIIIRVRGGSFVKVRRVDLRSFGPLSQRQLREAFGRMCLTSEGLLDGVFIGNITSCFNKRRVQSTIERFVSELHELGYPEARIRVEPHFVDPHKTDDLACALTPLEVERYESQGLTPPPICVDLAVTVDAGTKVTTRFHPPSGERPLVDLPELFGGTFLWLRETLLEPSSRALQIATGAPPSGARDTDLVEKRIQESVTFFEASSVDETEVEVSAKNAEAYVASRGRVSPDVVVDDREFPGERLVDFHVQQSLIAFVSAVRFVGNVAITDAELQDVELAARPRSFAHSGAVSFLQLADDEERIRSLYAERGYPEANVSATAVMGAREDIEVVFTIDEGEPFVLAGLILAGGAPEVTPDVLRAIRHCAGGSAAREDRPPEVVEDCQGAPLRPDELEADAQRVQSVYASRGYPNVDATVETSFSPRGPVLRITVVPPDASAEERRDPQAGNVRQVRLGEVFLEGNRVTRRDVLLREVGLEGKAGEPLDPITLGKGISRLRRTGLYESVDLQYLGLDGESDRAHVRLAVSERPAFTVDSSIGFSTEQLLSLRNEVRHRNAFGTMLDASWLVDFGLFVGRFSQTRIQVRWPRILGSDVSASFVPLSMSYADRPAGVRLKVPSTPAGQKATAAWEAPDLRRRLFSTGGSLGLDWRVRDVSPWIDDKLTIGVAVELRYDWLDVAGEPVAVFSREAFETVDGLLTVFDKDVTQVATLTPRIAWNNVDNPFDPKDGTGVELFFRGSTPPFVQHGPFGVLGISGRTYRTFFERLTLAVGGRARLGFAAASPDCEDPGCEWALMQNDLLLLGGERSVRGVPENEIGVLGPAYDQKLEPVLENGEQLVQLHPGFYGVAGSIELRYTLVRQFFIGELKPAVFIDAGMSTDDLSIDFFPAPGQPPDVRYAIGVGAGLRYVLPVGPLSFDFAWSPTRNRTAFYVVFGYIF
jgi:outer membrane protein assembly factor BamA